MPQLVTIPMAFFEIVIEYSRPNMKLLIDRATAVDRLFEAFNQWKVRVDDVEVITEGKPSEQGIKFKLPTKKTSFMFGAGSCKLNEDDANWDSAEEIIKILDTGFQIISEIGEIKAGVFKTTIALHIQPKTAKFTELLKPFAPPQLLALDPSAIKAAATVVKWEKRRITIDGSNQIANGIFLRIEREFEGSTSYNEIAEQLFADEYEVLRLIGVEEDRS